MPRLSFATSTPNRLTRAGYVSMLGLTTAIIGNSGIGDRAQAQLACQPPQASEYLLLMVTPTAESQARVTAVLPVSNPATVCNYFGTTVMRLGGFATPESANAWSDYVAKQAKVSAFVAKPSTTGGAAALPPLPPLGTATTGMVPTTVLPGTVPSATVLPTTPIMPNSVGGVNPIAYGPQAIGNGYAVLVNYYSTPAVATQLRQSTGQPVSLVAYGQQPFLLASFTNDQSAANMLLKALTDRGMWAMVVDGRRVMLVQPNVVQ